MSWYFKAISEYANFSTRASRKEFWMFTLVNVLLAIGLVMTTRIINGPEIILGIYQLFMAVPSLAISVRRLHDTNHSGWWYLCPIYNLVLLCTAGDPESNSYGPDPKNADPIAIPD